MRLFAAILLKEMYILSPRPHEEIKKEKVGTHVVVHKGLQFFTTTRYLSKDHVVPLSLSLFLSLSLSFSLSLSLWFYLSLFLSSISALLAMCSYRSLSLKRWTIFPEARSRRRSSSCLSLPKRAYRVNPYLTHLRLFV